MEKSDIHILILSSWYPSENSPFLGNLIVRQASMLGKKYKVTVVHTQVSDYSSVETKQRENFREIIVHFIAGLNVFIRKLNQRNAFIKGLDTIQNADVIIGNILIPEGWQFLLAKKKFNCPLLYLEHGSYFALESPFKWTFFNRIIRDRMMAKADEIFAVSDFLKRDMHRFFGKRKLQVIGNHIDLNLFCYKKKAKKKATHFLHISTLDPINKNPNGILKACSLLI